MRDALDLEPRKSGFDEHSGEHFWFLTDDVDSECSLVQHLEAVLSRIETKKEALIQLRSEDSSICFDVFCSVFPVYPIDSYSSARIQVDVSIIQRISNLGASLLFDVYQPPVNDAVTVNS